MKALYCLLFFFISTVALAQSQSWRITQNGKLLLQATEENSEKNIITVNRADLNRPDFLWVRFAGATAGGWVRTIYITGEKNEELAKHSGNLFRISNSTLKALFKNRSRVLIYTYTMPTDPKLKATVKVRRIHLCTVLIK
jgi:hypothetical protein